MKWILLILIVAVPATSANYTFTYSMAAKCKEHITQSGYEYKTFYRINHENQKLSPGVEFEMHIAILASSNGHILLSPISNPEPGDAVYEIVVGGGSNKFSEIRRSKGRNAKASTKTIGILSPVELRPFYIRINDGALEFGNENETLPLLSYYDVSPLTINYFSFASWHGVEAKFLYDCPAPNANETEEIPDSKLVEPRLTNSEKIRVMLLTDRPASVPPDPEVIVTVGVKVTSVTYNAFESKLDTGLAILLTWKDEVLAWNPSEFNETTTLKFRQGEIWKPSFLAQNADNLGALDSKSQEPIYMLNSGEASLHFQSKVITWCDDSSSYLSRWPRDEYNCSIMIRPWAVHEKVNIAVMNSKDDKMKIFADIDEVIKNEWILLSVNQELKNENNKSTIDDSVPSNMLVITLNIRRQALPYNLVFYTPLLVLMIFLLMSFWTQPLVMTRIWFYVGCITVICMGLSYIDCLVPTHKVPSIVVLYVCVLMATLFALIIQVILMHPSMAPVYNSYSMKSFLSRKFLRILFCLPPNKSTEIYESINEGFLPNDDEDSGVSTIPKNSNFEVMQSDNNTTVGEKEELAEVIDKILYIVYSTLFAVLIVLHY